MAKRGTGAGAGNSLKSAELFYSFWSLDMSAFLLEPPVKKDLHCMLDSLEDHVQSRLGSRVRDFQVRSQERGLILCGCAHTYHGKQLAQHYVMEMTDLPILVNDIQVV
jgi:hypothetical protein